MNYYYFAASLPSLTLDAPAPFSVDAFLAQCTTMLTPADDAIVRQALGREDGAARHPVVARWRGMDLQLRNAVAQARAARLKRDAAPFLRPGAGVEDDAHVHRVAAEALARATPIEREHALDHFRWRQAEALAGFSPFTIEALVAYAIHLSLAQRWTGLSDPVGRERAETLTAQAGGYGAPDARTP